MSSDFAIYLRISTVNLIMSSETKPSLAACEYKTGKTLGQGSYGVVKEGIKIQTGEKYAIKVISKKLMRGREGIVMNEINILKKISKGHKHIVTLVDYFESPNNRIL
jgi:serine/threonine protein kinase